MKRVLVIGYGQLGKELEYTLNKDRYEALFVGSRQLDLTLSRSIIKGVESYKPDLIINAGAYTAVDKAETQKDLAYAVNAEGPKYLAVLCAKIEIPLIHISTDYVFDGESIKAYTEDDTINPLSVYGQTKAEGESFIKESLN